MDYDSPRKYLIKAIDFAPPPNAHMLKIIHDLESILSKSFYGPPRGSQTPMQEALS